MRRECGRVRMVATTAVPRAVRPRARAATGERQRALWREWARSLDRPLTSYYLILGTGVLLIALGLVMVLSSTMVNSITETGSAFSMFQRQLTSAAIGLPLMLLAAHLPVSGFRVIGYQIGRASCRGRVWSEERAGASEK